MNSLRQLCDLCVLLRLKSYGGLTCLEIMNGRKRSQRAQKETQFFTTEDTEESRGDRWQENGGQEYLERSRDMVSLSSPGWHRNEGTRESQSAERLNYVGDVAPPTRIPVNAHGQQRRVAGRLLKSMLSSTVPEGSRRSARQGGVVMPANGIRKLKMIDRKRIATVQKVTQVLLRRTWRGLGPQPRMEEMKEILNHGFRGFHR